jgi:diacylglycerol kinase
MRQTTRSSVPPGRHPLPDSEWGRFIAGFSYAFQGLKYAFRTQRNMRVHAAIAALAIFLGLFFHLSAVEFAMVFIAITSVFIAEMFNTVIELCVDLSTPDYHPLAKIAKDVAAGTVLLSAFLAVIIGLFVFVPHL